MATPGQDPYGYPKLDIKAARALNPHTQTIRIESILGGHSPTSNFASRDQFSDSLGIDPAAFIFDQSFVGSGVGVNLYEQRPSGLLRPSDVGASTGFSLSAVVSPLWFVQEAKKGAVYMYLSSGSAYSTISDATGFTALSDGGSLSSSLGNGCEYYDNYIYFAKNTDIARYGPLNGSPSFDATYWTSTLSKAALTNTIYPLIQTNNFNLATPNHIMHRHSDGKLYIADVVGNQGTIHVISTTKTTVEGDTDNGSTANKLQFGYGLWPTAIESYGSQLVIAFFESFPATNNVNSRHGPRAKIAFWDTTSANFNSITWVEFPDQLITSIKNIDGTLYIASSASVGIGFRISEYIGGNSFRDVLLHQTGYVPFPGGMDGDTNQLIIAALSGYPTQTYSPSVISIGLGIPGTKGKIFNLGGAPSGTSKFGTAVALVSGIASRKRKQVFFGYSDHLTGMNVSTSPRNVPSDGSVDYSLITRRWLSQKYNIGVPFKITKIVIPLAVPIGTTGGILGTTTVVTPTVYMDDGSGTKYIGGTNAGLSVINNANYSGKNRIVMRPVGMVGNNNFQLEFVWTGSELCIISLPIIVEYELIPE